MIMSNTLNNEFEKRVKTLVEGLGYALDVEFDSTDKKAYLISISELSNVYSKDEQNNVMPYAVVTFRSSNDINVRNMALALYDDKRWNCGEIKLIGHTLDCDDNIPYIQNLVYHDVFPGEDFLKVPMYDDELDYLEDYWDNYVQKVSYRRLQNNHYSWFPNDYYDLPEKEGFELRELGEDTFATAVGELFERTHSSEIVFSNYSCHKKGSYFGRVVLLKDLKSSQVDYKLVADDIPSDRKGEDEYYEIVDKEAIVVSVSGDLKPTLIDASGDTIYVPLSEMSVIDMSRMEDFDAEYLVKELQKDYVAKQIEDKCRSIMNDRNYILGLVKVYVPLGSNGLPSIEEQKKYVQKQHSAYVRHLEEELEKEQEKYLKSYKEVCDYCKDKGLNKELNKTFKDLLIKLEKDEISNDDSVFNQIRKIVEWVKLRSPGYLNKYKDIQKLNTFSKAIDDDPNIPEYIARSFHMCVSLGNEGSHPDDPSKRKRTAPLVTKSVKERKASYATKSVMYSLLNILFWCKDLEETNNI